ncbi:MAG: hypothetical protein CR977_03075 [Gammaproteobacteria bacterium]|nr:MAG: hypothetical protein CR977_03075 [Gammaproteobacteria bacterium]
MSKKQQINAKWAKEKQAVRATQVAFDLAEKVQHRIRKQAVQENLTPSDYIRKTLGLKISARPKRLRLSVSLTPDDMLQLAERFGLTADDRIAIKQKAAEALIEHAEHLENHP